MTHLCTCPVKRESTSEVNKKRSYLAQTSCRSCGGRFSVDGIGSISGNMLNSVCLEVANSINPELSWKAVTKGRRSRKPLARTLNGGTKPHNRSPKRVGDFSGSDSDKFDAPTGHHFSDKEEHVPIKKRRHILQSSSPQPQIPLSDNESLSPQCVPPMHSDAIEQFLDHNHSSSHWSSDLTSSKLVPGFDKKAAINLNDNVDSKISQVPNGKCYKLEDFSGIVLLAAAACINDMDDTDNDKDKDKECHSVIASSAPKGSAEFDSSHKEILVLKQLTDQGDMMHTNNAEASIVMKDSAVAPKSLAECEEYGKGNRFCSPKVDRLHWDLNTLMDEWEQPNAEASMDKTSEDGFNDGSQVEKLKEDSCGKKGDSEDIHDARKYMPLDQKWALFECANPRAEDSKSELLSTHNSTCLEEISVGSLGRNCSEESSAERKTESQLINLNACTADSSVSKLHNPSNMLIADGVMNTALEGGLIMTQTGETSAKVGRIVNDALNDEHLLDSSDVPFPSMHGQDDPIKTCKLPDTDSSVFNVIGVESSKSKPAEAYYSNPSLTCEDLSATRASIPEVQYASEAESKEQNDRVSAGEINFTDSLKQLEGKDLDVSNEVEERMPVVNDCSRSCTEGSQVSDRASQSVKIGSTLEHSHNSDISQGGRGQMIDPENMVGFETGYDSPFEDGELRESIFYSLEDNVFEEGENECVDYGSDGIDSLDSDTADHPASEIVEAGSESSQGIDKRISSRAGGSEVDFGNVGSPKSSLRRHFNRDDLDNIAMDGREGLDVRSGAVQQSAYMVLDGNEGNYRQSHTSDHLGAFEFGGYYKEEVGAKTNRGKLQSRIERPYLDARDGKDAMLMQQTRPCSNRLGSSYNRRAREVSPKKFNGGYQSSFGLNVRSGGNGQPDWWNSRRRSPSSCNTSKGRSYKSRRYADSAGKFGGLDSRDHQQHVNLSFKGVNKPQFRRRSSVERGNYYDVHKRMPPARGGYESSGGGGSFSQRSGRGFIDEFYEPVPDDTNLRPLHMLRRKSRSRSRSRSPNAWRTQRKQNFSTRWRSGSPNLRSDGRMDRKRMPFRKAGITTECDEGGVSPPRGHCFPERRSRWAEGRSFVGHHSRHKGSPGNVIRQNQLDSIGPTGRFRSDDYRRPIMRPGRFVPKSGTGRGGKFEGKYNEKRHDGSEICGTRPYDSGGGVKRFVPYAEDGFEAGNSNPEEDIRSTDCNNILRNAREDETSSKA